MMVVVVIVVVAVAAAAAVCVSVLTSIIITIAIVRITWAFLIDSRFMSSFAIQAAQPRRAWPSELSFVAVPRGKGGKAGRGGIPGFRT